MNQFDLFPRRAGCPYFRQRGFSLIEMMVVIAISGILVALAAPSFKSMIDSYQVDSTTKALTSALELTRATAIQMNGNTSITKIAGASCSNADDWSCGWNVLADLDGDGAVDDVVQTFPADGNVQVTRSTSGASMSANRWGQLNGTNTAGFVLVPHGGNVSSPAGITLCMNSGGRIRTFKSNDQPSCPA